MLRFNEKGKFTILQVSDPQDLQYVRKTMLKMLGRAYYAVQPDLVVFTGDNILGNHLRDARFGSRKVVKTKEGELKNMRTAINHICAQVEEYKLPFTMIFGNHDDMNEITKKEQADIFREYPHCIGLDDPSSPDEDTFSLQIMSHSSDRPAYNLWFMDSAWYDREEDRCHTGVKKEAVEWYVNKSNELRDANGGKPLPSVMFQHIAPPEIKDTVWFCLKHEEGAVKLRHDGKTYYLQVNPQYGHGRAGEPESVCKENYGEFKALKQQGDIKALVLGHDHLNCFEADFEGIHILQSAAASFRCYGDKSRGVRVIILDENNPDEIETFFLTYEDLCGKSIAAKAAYIWDADGEQVKKYGGLALAAAVPAAGILLSKLIKSHRR